MCHCPASFFDTGWPVHKPGLFSLTDSGHNCWASAISLTRHYQGEHAQFQLGSAQADSGADQTGTRFVYVA